MCSRFLIAAALLPGLGCSRHNEVDLVFAEAPTGEGGALAPHGFMCRVGEQTMAALASAAASDAGLDTSKACVVTDLVWWDYEGFPGCRSAELINFCLEHGCHPERRGVVEADVPDAGTIAERVQAALQDIRGMEARLWNTNDTPLIVRVFATFQSCGELEQEEGKDPPEHDPDLVFGCAHSCPVMLDDVRGELLLDLDTLDPECERSVRICASDGFAGSASDAGVE